MIFGYARTSTKEQNIDRQEQLLKNFGCEQIFSEQISGKSMLREQLHKVLNSLEEGDTLVVCELSRLGRSLKDLLNICDKIHDKKADFVCLNSPFDTRSSWGKLIFQILGALSEFERALLAERINSGIANARKKGVVFGRRKKLNDEKYKLALLLAEKGYSKRQIWESLGISKALFYDKVNPLIKEHLRELYD